MNEKDKRIKELEQICLNYSNKLIKAMYTISDLKKQLKKD